jgi:hypothetical protein
MKSMNQIAPSANSRMTSASPISPTILMAAPIPRQERMPGHSGSARPLLSRQRPSDLCSLLVASPGPVVGRRIGAQLLCARSRALRSCEMAQRRRLNYCSAQHRRPRQYESKDGDEAQHVLSGHVPSGALPEPPIGSGGCCRLFRCSNSLISCSTRESSSLHASARDWSSCCPASNSSGLAQPLAQSE